MIDKFKYIGKSKKYKNVYVLLNLTNNKLVYRGQYKCGDSLKSRMLYDELSAAKWVDIELIKNNKPQKNNTLKKL